MWASGEEGRHRWSLWPQTGHRSQSCCWSCYCQTQILYLQPAEQDITKLLVSLNERCFLCLKTIWSADYLDVGHSPPNLMDKTSSICARCVRQLWQPAVLTWKHKREEELLVDQKSSHPLWCKFPQGWCQPPPPSPSPAPLRPLGLAHWDPPKTYIFQK